MSDVAYAAALVLAGLFAWAGASKLLQRDRTTRTFAAFGLPAPHVLGTAVPATELLLAVGLVLIPAVAAYLALGLLAAFTTFLLRAVRAGVDIGCGCFGSASTAPVSAVDVLRNGLLGACALVATLATGPTVPGLGSILLVAAAAAAGLAGLTIAARRGRSGVPWSARPGAG